MSGNPNGIILMVTGPISMISSITIVAMIMRSRAKLSISYHRLMCGISLTDIILSSGLSLSSLPAPKGTPGAWKALGNRSTCNAQGFLIMFGTNAAPAYFFSLQVYYLCKIKYHTNSENMEKVELCLHGVPILLGLIGSIIASATNSMNPGTRGYCWLQDFPLHCVDNQNVDCIRGTNYLPQRQVLATIYITFVILTGIVMYMIYASVRKQDTRNATHNFEIQSPRSSPSSNAPGNRRRSFIRPPEEILRTQYEKSRKTRVRVLQYFYAYFFTLIFPFVDAALHKVQNVSVDKILEILFMIAYPLWGFFNLVVFILPAVNKVRKRNEELSLPRAFVIAIISYVGPRATDYQSRTSTIATSQNNFQNLSATVPTCSTDDPESNS